MNPHKISKISKFFIYFSLFLPLFFVPFTMWEFIFVRSLIFYCLVAILLFLGLLYLYKDRHNINFKVNILFWLIFGFVIIRILSGIFGADSHNSFFGSQIRMDGNLSYLMIFSWLVVLLLFLNSQEDWIKLFKVSAIVALIVSVFAVIQAFFPNDFGALRGKGSTPFLYHRLTGSLGNPIFLAGYLLPHIFLSLYLAIKEKRDQMKYFWIVLSAIFIFIVLLTRARSTIVALFIALVLLGGILIFRLIHSKRKISFKKIAIFGAPPLVLTGFIVINTDLIKHLTNFSLSSGTIATRLMLWKIGINAFLDKWLLGWGPENFTYAFSKFYNPQILKFSFYETWADKPHNQLIEIAVTSGILGLIAFLSIIIFSLYALWRLIKKDKGNIFKGLLIGGVAISYFIHIFFAFDTLELRMIFFMILGYIIFLSSSVLSKVYKLSFSLIRGFVLILLITAIFSLNIIGIKTIQASYYTDRARDSIIDNQYADTKSYFNKLKDTKTPYKNGNWEILADKILEGNAVGRLPRSVMLKILPIIITGLEEAVEEQESNFSYHYRLGQMYSLAGDYIDKKYFDKSIEVLEKAKKISPKRQVSDLLLAQIYYSKRDVERGIKILEDLIKENPNIAEPYWYIGILYDANGEYDKSYAYMTTAAEKGRMPRNINEMFLYVTVLGRYNDYYKMVPIYENIIEIDKKNPRWWANLATVYLELERYEKARNATRQAMFLDPKFGDEGEDFLRRIEAKENHQ